ncbi:MAG: hypothetical protein V9G20_26690 [Candidatus Promineifilaceae bacterium]
MTTEKPISRDEAIHQIATQLEGPISLEVFTEQGVGAMAFDKQNRINNSA